MPIPKPSPTSFDATNALPRPVTPALPRSSRPDLFLSTFFDTKEDDRAFPDFREVTEPWFKSRPEAYGLGSRYVVKSNSSSLSHNDAKRVLSNFVRVYGVLGEQLVLPTVGDSLVNGRLRSGWTVGATWRTNYSPPGLMAPLVQPLDRALPRVCLCLRIVLWHD